MTTFVAEANLFGIWFSGTVSGTYSLCDRILIFFKLYYNPQGFQELDLVSYGVHQNRLASLDELSLVICPRGVNVNKKSKCSCHHFWVSLSFFYYQLHQLIIRPLPLYN